MRHYIRVFPILFMLALLAGTARAEAPKEGKQNTSAVSSLLREAKTQYDDGQHEQAAALLERALRIDPRSAVLWHNLAGVRLQQQDWARAASLAAKSNSLSATDKNLRIRNWVLIAIACNGMGDSECNREAGKRAQVLAGQR
jgi:Tfp pilus assembly protein PilF